MKVLILPLALVVGSASAFSVAPSRILVASDVSQTNYLLRHERVATATAHSVGRTDVRLVPTLMIKYHLNRSRSTTFFLFSAISCGFECFRDRVGAKSSCSRGCAGCAGKNRSDVEARSLFAQAKATSLYLNTHIHRKPSLLELLHLLGSHF